jgi:hypothetical protein
MSATAAVRRLAAMDRDELRFRLTCEARKAAGRLRCAIDPPRLRHADLARILDPSSGPLIALACRAAQRGDALEAHRALSRHFATRTSPWPLQSSSRAALASALQQAFPGAAPQAAGRADRILNGHHDLLGYRDVPLGNPPAWHADAVHKKRAPEMHWAAVPYLDPACGDHKIIWETNRHQYWLTLGAAYWLTGNSRYRQAFVAHLESWLRANPPLIGVNWASMLELAFRTMSWTWAVEFFADGGESDTTPWLVGLLLSLDRQLTHIGQNLSQYFSPNTHLLGEALALYAVSTALPELRRSHARISSGRTILVREIERQVRPDGGHAELSAHYHRYATDFYLLALMVARASGDIAAPAFERVSRRLSAYLRTMADDRGAMPLIGDDDGGQMFRFGDAAPADASPTLAVAATLLSDRSLAVGPPAEEVYWILGRHPDDAAAIETGVERTMVLPWGSRVMRDSGYFVSRTADGGHLVFDGGPHGFLNGGHAHADALSVVLSVGGEPLLVDPGTATYTMDPVVRDQFRSSRMHNTLVLNGRDHAVPRGPFHWHSRADARFLVARTAPGLDFAVATHNGYDAGRHMRAVLAIHGLGWLVVDRVGPGKPVAADTWWHLHPSWRAELRDGIVMLQSAAGRLAFASTADSLAIVDDPKMATVAPEYGRVEPSLTIRASRAGSGPFEIAAFVPASAALSERVSLTAEASPPDARAGWACSAFHVHSGTRDFRVVVAFPASQAQPDDENWPQPCIDEVRVCAG